MENKAIRIAQMHWGFPPIIGGVETHLTILLPELINRGHKVYLLTGSVEGVKTRYRYKGVEVYRTPLFDLNWLFKRGLKGLEEEIRSLYNSFFDEVKPDICHVHNMHYFSDTHIRMLDEICRSKGVPIVLTAHNVWDDITFLRLTIEINWTHIISVSHYIKKELMGTGLDDRKITVIHHGIDPLVFHPNGKPDKLIRKYPEIKDKKVIFHPARMGLAKGCDVSIKAINMVKEKFPNALLVMAGTKNIIDWGATQQKEIAYFLDLIKMFNLKENVLIDFFALDEIPEMYNISKVCVYPSSRPEPFGITMLEALAATKPMIVTNMGGMPEIIRDGINGYVIPLKDFETLATRIIHLLANERLRKRLGYTGREMIVRHFTKEIMTDCVIDVYKNLLK